MTLQMLQQDTHNNFISGTAGEMPDLLTASRAGDSESLALP